MNVDGYKDLVRFQRQMFIMEVEALLWELIATGRVGSVSYATGFMDAVGWPNPVVLGYGSKLGQGTWATQRVRLFEPWSKPQWQTWIEERDRKTPPI